MLQLFELIKIIFFFAMQLNLMKTQIGPERVMSLLGGLDESVLENLAEHINIPLKTEQ